MTTPLNAIQRNVDLRREVDSLKHQLRTAVAAESAAHKRAEAEAARIEFVLSRALHWLRSAETAKGRTRVAVCVEAAIRILEGEL